MAFYSGITILINDAHGKEILPRGLQKVRRFGPEEEGIDHPLEVVE
jgi:hypothetical protein